MPTIKRPENFVPVESGYPNFEPNLEPLSPEVRAMLDVLDVPVEMVDFDYGSEFH